VTSSTTATPTSLWASLQEALRGSRQDFTEGSLNRAILLLAVPMVLEMAMESLFSVVDIFVVAHLGKEQAAAVGLTESMVTVLFTVGVGLSVGATALVARRIGEKDARAASRTAAQALVVSVLIAVPLSLGGIAYAKQLLGLMGASPWVLEHGATYARVMLGGSGILVMLLFVLNAIFRAAGDAATAMRTLWLANGVNIVLAPALVLGLGPFESMGVTGAAVATTIGRGVGVLYQLSHLCRPGGRIRVTLRDLGWERATIRSILGISTSAGLQYFIGTASWVFMARIVASFESAAVAGYVICLRIVMFAILPSYGIANAAATLVGQSLGAGKPERAEQAVWRAAAYNALLLGTVGVGFLIFTEPLVRFFTADSDVIATVVRGLRLVSCGFLFYAYGMVLTTAFNGAGDTRTPTIVNLVCFWLFAIPTAYVGTQWLGWGVNWVFATVAGAYTAQALLAALLFRRGAWKAQKV
jgi:putative MATE family efflux protein